MQLTRESVVKSSRSSNSSEILRLSFKLTTKNEEDQVKNKAVKSCHNIFPIITLWELSVVMVTKVHI